MNERKMVNLYDQYKNTPKKLKIICDWDEVIQACEPYALWKSLKPGENKMPTFFGFYEEFWGLENNIEYSPYGSKLKITEGELREKQIQIKNSPTFYHQAPFLTIAEDLLKLIKEDKVEKLIFLSAYDKKVFPNGDERKWDIFDNTFQHFDRDIIKENGERASQRIRLKLIPFDNEAQGQTKADWIKYNAKDFDVLIDDNPNICKSIIKSNNHFLVKPCPDCMKKYMGECHGETGYSCDNCQKMNMAVIAPYYPAIENQHNERVLLVKQEVSNLKKEDFSK